jgi:hypothetical protein
MSTGTFSLLTSSPVFNTAYTNTYPEGLDDKGNFVPCNYNDMATSWSSTTTCDWHTGNCTTSGTLTCATKPTPAQAADLCPKIGPQGSVTAIDAHYNLSPAYQDSSCYLAANPNTSGLNSISLKNGPGVPLVCTYNYSDVITNFTTGDAMQFLNNFQGNTGTSPCAYPYTDNPQTVYNKIMGAWCSQPGNPRDNYTPMRMSDEPLCQKWCGGATGTCWPIMNQYCKATSDQLLDPVCTGPQGFCATTTDQYLNCDSELTNYCQNLLSDEEALVQPVCACFMKPSFYQNYFNSLSNTINLAVTEDLPACFYGPCAASPIKSSDQKTKRGPGGKACPDVNACITVAEVDNQGTIKGSIVINQDVSCVGQVSLKSCPEGQVVDPTTGLKCLTMYECSSGACSPSSKGTYQSLEQCQAACSPQPPQEDKYSCSNGVCTTDPNGLYSSLQECTDSCEKKTQKISPYVLYSLIGVAVLVVLILLVKFFRSRRK